MFLLTIYMFPERTSLSSWSMISLSLIIFLSSYENYTHNSIAFVSKTMWFAMMLSFACKVLPYLSSDYSSHGTNWCNISPFECRNITALYLKIYELHFKCDQMLNNLQKTVKNQTGFIAITLLTALPNTFTICILVTFQI